VAPASYTSKLAGQLHQYASEDILSGPYLLEEYKPDMIRDFLSHLRATNFRMMLVTESFPADEWRKAAHYGTEYIQLPLPLDLTNVNLFVLINLLYLMIFI
jgi:insulysin